MVQKLRPNSDSIPASVGTYLDIDEITKDTSDYIESTNLGSGTSETAEYHLSNPSDPLTNTGHIVSVTGGKNISSGRAITYTITLRQGTTTIATVASGSYTDNTPVDHQLTLSGAQADSITNYNDLRIRVKWVGGSGGGGGRRGRVYWAEMEIPDAPTVVNPGLATSSESAFSVGILKTLSIGLSTSTESALSITRLRVYDIGLSASAESSFSITWNKTLQVGLAASIEEAFALSASTTVICGIATSTESAFSVSYSKALTPGLASSSESAFSVTPERSYSVGLATSAESGLALVLGNILEVGLATSSESAFPCYVEGGGAANNYDGTNDYERETGLSLSDGKEFTISVFFKQAANHTTANIVMSTGNILRLYFTGDYIQCEAENGASTDILVLSTNTQIVGPDTSWHHVIVSADLANNKGHIYIDDADDEDTGFTVKTNQNIDFSGISTMSFGGGTIGNSKFNGCFSEFWLDFRYYDITQESVRRNWIDQYGKPVHLGPDGSLPGAQPFVYAPDGDPNNANLGSGATWDIVGALDACADTPRNPVTFVSAGLATSTETAFAVTANRGYDVGLSTSSESAFSVGWSKAANCGLATSSESALGLISLKEKVVGLATSTESAFSISIPVVVIAGLATSSESAFAIQPLRTYSLGLSSNAETALAINVDRALNLGLATSTESAFSATWSKTVQVGLATSTESAFAVSVPLTRFADLATSSEIAFSITALKEKAIGLSSSSEIAFSISVTKEKAIGLAISSESALSLTINRGYNIGLATSTESAFEVIRGEIIVQPGLATSTESAFPVSIDRALNVGLATSPEVGFSLSIEKAISVGLATSPEIGFSITASKVKDIGLAISTEQAFNLTFAQVVMVGLATESSSTFPITHRREVPAGISLENDTALPVEIIGGNNSDNRTRWTRRRLREPPVRTTNIDSDKFAPKRTLKRRQGFRDTYQ